MNTKVITAIFAVALLTVGCANEPDSGALKPNDTSIGLYTAVTETRAVDTDDTVLKGSQLDLYAYTSTGEEKTLAFNYANSEWGTNATWGDVGVPTTFFAASDGSAKALTNVTATSATLNYTTPAETADLVYFGTTVTELPLDGGIHAQLEHATSKISFSATTGTNKVYIASVKLKHVDNSATLTINSDNTAAWSDNNNAYDTDYSYRTTDAPGASVGEASLATTDNALMIIPQSTQAYEEVETDVDTYIEVIYYATKANGDPLVGYSKCSAYTGDRALSAANSGIGDSDPLYVKVAFPLKHNFEAGTHYNITLGLGANGTSGGMVLSENYVNYQGVEIELKDNQSFSVVPNLTVGEYVLDGNEGLIIDEESWGGELGSVDAPYQIKNATEFMFMANFSEVYCELTEDIDFTDVDYIPFEFNGVFDGNDHYIKNLTLDTPYVAADGTGYIGLFSKIGEGSTVKDLVLDYTCTIDVDYSNNLVGGAIAAQNYGTIIGCVPYNYNDQWCFTSDKSSTVGGYVGINRGTVESTNNVVDIVLTVNNTEDTIVGSLVGANYGTCNIATTGCVTLTINSGRDVIAGCYVGSNYKEVSGDGGYLYGGHVFTLPTSPTGDVYLGGAVGLMSGNGASVTDCSIGEGDDFYVDLDHLSSVSHAYVAGVVGYIDSDGTTVSNNHTRYFLSGTDGNITKGMYFNAKAGVTVTASGNSQSAPSLPGM